MKEVGSKRKMANIMNRIYNFLSKDKSSKDDIDLIFEYTFEYSYVRKLISRERLTENFALKQIFESVCLNDQMESARVYIESSLKPRTIRVFTSQFDELKKISEIEKIYQAYVQIEKIGEIQDIVTEEFLKIILRNLMNNSQFEIVIKIITEVLNSELSWTISCLKYSNDTGLKELIEETWSNTMLKLVFNKTDYFPVNNLEQFAHNYQMYYMFVELQFRDLNIPEKIQTHLKKKENLLYKAYVMNVIKKLEVSLIQLSSSFEKSNSREAIEDYAKRKYSSSIHKIISDLILSNISKDTVTSSLLHRVFSLGLRTILRIEDFYKQLYSKVKIGGIKNLLIESNLEIFKTIKPDVAQNINEIASKLGLKKDL